MNTDLDKETVRSVVPSIFQIDGDAVPDKGVTSFRREVKFALPAADKSKIRSILDINCEPVIYNRAESEVRSIYFDDLALSSCRANFDGTGNRTKIRVRWYDNVLPAGTFFFEVKRRTGQMIHKDRVKIIAPAETGSMMYKRLVSELAETLSTEHGEMLMMRPEPVVIVEYRRRHYHVPGSPVRLTLDYDIACYSQAGKSKPDSRFPIYLQDLVILEVKTPAGGEEEVRGLLYPLSPRVTRCSKYVRSCQLLGMSTGAGAALLD